MQALLEDLNSLPGVVGSMFCNAREGVLARAFPAEFTEADLEALAAAVADSSRDLPPVTGAISVVDLRYRDTRVVVRPAGDAALLVMCDKSANAQEVLAFAAVACKKLERLQHPVAGASGQFLAPAAASARSMTLAVRPTDAVPRRRLPVALAVAAAVLLALGAGAAATYFFIPGLRGAAPAAPRAPAVDAVATEPKTTAVPVGAGQIVLRISGADALAAQLVTALAQAYLASLGGADPQVLRPAPEQIQVQASKADEPVAISIASGGTAKGLDDLLAGSADVAVATRRVRVDEREKLSVLGTITSQANEHVLGLNGVAVIVNKANAVARLDREQLASVLSGGSSDWSQFGVAGEDEWSAVGVTGKGGPVASGIHVYLPDDRSGISEVVQAAVLGKKPFSPEAKRFPSFQAVTNAVLGDPGGVGLVPLPEVNGARAVPISDLDDPPMIPTSFTVAAEEYFLTHRLYLYTAQASTNPNVARFVEFALGTEGQAVVKKAGFVELAVKAERRTAPAGAPPEYLTLTAGARRLSSTFRFESNSSAFDNRAIRDLDRVVGFLRDNDLNGASVRVLGFADAMGTRARNQLLSSERAALVARAFAQRGISGVTVAGLSSSLPVADNASEEGRQRNRRVEIWVAQR